jgi:hypothetical protein
MTLIGAVRTDTKLLIGADHALIYGPPYSMPFNVPAPKLFTTGLDPTFEWGFAGGHPAGAAFGRWLGQQTFTSWDQAATSMGLALATANGKGRALAQTAGATTFEGVEVLAIAKAFGAAQVLYIDDEGGTTFVAGTPMFIGGGAPFAMIGYNAAVRAGAAAADAFRAAIEVATEVVPLLGMPAEVRQIPI